MSMDWVVQQIEASLRAAKPRAPQFNPWPKGVPWPGRATEAVLTLLARHPGRWFSHYEIAAECKQHSRAALGWALIRLRSWGVIESTPDLSRNSTNSRYLRYRLTKSRPQITENG